MRHLYSPLVMMLLLAGDLESVYGNYGIESGCAPEDAASIWVNMAKCTPRETIVQVPQLLDPALYQIVPSNVPVLRCSGTCHQGSKYHNCIPTEAGVSKHQIMIQRVNGTGHVYSMCTEVDIEEHLACSCGCETTESDCNKNQYFNPSLCECQCSDRNAKAQCLLSEAGNKGKKVWDPVNCQCRCAEAFRECSTGYVYDQMDTCSCKPQLRPASTVPVVALLVALIGTLTCLVLVIINYRKTRKVLAHIQAQRQRELEESKVMLDNNTLLDEEQQQQQQKQKNSVNLTMM